MKLRAVEPVEITFPLESRAGIASVTLEPGEVCELVYTEHRGVGRTWLRLENGDLFDLPRERDIDLALEAGRLIAVD